VVTGMAGVVIVVVSPTARDSDEAAVLASTLV